MNTTNLQQPIEKTNDFVGTLSKVMPRRNGTPAQFSALAEAFNRNGIKAEYNAALQANLNKKCLPNPSTLTNTFKTI